MARIAQEPWLEHLRVHLDALRVDVTPAAVHQLRVALARLRVWTLLADEDDVAPEVRWLRRAASTIRDLDVQLSMPALPLELASRLRADRQRAVAALSRVARGRRASALVDTLASLGSASARRARKRLRRLAGRALARGDRGFAADREAEHALRRAVRRVRFGLEWLGDECPPLVELQSALGDVNDRAMALVGARGRSARVTRYRAVLSEELAAAEARALRQWSVARVSLAALI